MNPLVYKNGIANLHIKYLYLLLLLFLVISGIIYFSFSTNKYTNDQIDYAIIIISLGIIPCFITLCSKYEKKLIPLFPLHSLYIAISYGLPLFWENLHNLGPLPEFSLRINLPEFDEFHNLDKSLILIITGQIFLYIGYYAFAIFFKKIKPIKVIAVTVNQKLWVSLVMFGGYLILELTPSISSMPSINQLINPLGYVSLGTLFLLNINHKISPLVILIAYLGIVYVFIKSLLSGSLMPPILFLLFFGILYWNSKKKIPIVLIILSTSFIFILNPIKSEFRAYIWNDPKNLITIHDKAQIFIEMIESNYIESKIIEKVSKDSSALSRIANLQLFNYVVSVTPEYIPYWDGKTYYTIWTSFIPRALWKEKPQATVGQDFGHRYGILQMTDQNTSINLPWLIEFYCNYGDIGVVVGMFFVGVFFRILVQKLSVSHTSSYEHALGVTLVFGLIIPESNFALMVGGILPIFVVLIIFSYLILELYKYNKN